MIDNLKRLLKLNLDDVERQIKDFYDKYGDNPDCRLGIPAQQSKVLAVGYVYTHQNKNILKKVQ